MTKQVFEQRAYLNKYFQKKKKKVFEQLKNIFEQVGLKEAVLKLFV
jgi:thiaminase